MPLIKTLSFNIINNFRKGNQKAFQKIFIQLYPAICYFAKKYLADADGAEDVAQETLMELWNQRSKFRDINQIKAFLYFSAKNKCLNIIKHLHIKEKYQQLQISQEHKIPVFEDEVVQAEVIRNINLAIDSLSDQRKKIIIFGMQGLKNHEIAKKLNISVNTVKLQKKIAYQRLRRILGSSEFSILIL